MFTKQILSVWWSIMWRGTLVGYSGAFVLGFLVGVIIGVIKAIFEIPDTGNLVQIISGIVGGIWAIGAGIWAVGASLRVNKLI